MISIILFALLFPIGVVIVSVGIAYWYGAKAERLSWSKQALIVSMLLAVAIGWMVWYGTDQFSLHKMQHSTRAYASQNERLEAMGKQLFSVHCAICHGEAGNAPKGKGANLTRRISFESALLNIQRGANNFRHAFPSGMPPMIPNTERAAQVAHYVSSGFSENELGEKLYDMIYCAKCHGEDGRGREYMGPNIREFDLPTIAMVLKHGKEGVIGKMPKFDQLTPEEVQALGLYILSIQEQP